MNNCLVTKLNFDVQNDKLPLLGSLKIHKSGKNGVIEIESNVDETLRIVGDGYFTDATFSENKGKEFEVKAGVRKEVCVSYGEFDIIIPNKYKLRYLRKDADGRYVGAIEDVNELKWCEDLREIVFFAGLPGVFTQEIADTLVSLEMFRVMEVECDLSVIAKMPKLTSFQCHKAFGTLSDLLKYNKINYVDLRLEDTLVSGDVAEFFENLAEHGRGAESLRLRTSRNMTFNGVSIPNSNNFNATFQSQTSFSVVYNSATYRYTKSGDAWSYVVE